jgi:pimeloyl-ACP methyl ester carboxylesterase
VQIACCAGLPLVALLAACLDQPARADERAEDQATATAPAVAMTLADAPDRFLDRGAVTIRYRVIGPDSGTPMLLLHGYTDRVEMWSGTADSLARTHRVIVPDVRGFGRSVPSDSTTPYGQAMVDDQVALLEALDVQRVHLVGYSMGGLLSANMVLRHPERIASATFVAGAFFEDSAETTRVLEPSIAALETEEGLIPFFRYIMPSWPDSLLIPAARQYFADNDRTALVRVARSLGSLALDWAAVRRTTVPAVIVVGTKDGVFDMSQRMAARWPGARYLEAQGADHADISLRPEAIAAVRMAVSLVERPSAIGAAAR